MQTPTAEGGAVEGEAQGLGVRSLNTKPQTAEVGAVKVEAPYELNLRLHTS